MAKAANSRAQPKPAKVPAKRSSPARPDRCADAVETGIELVWDLGRAYYAYVGVIERVLVEQQLDQLLRPGMGLVLFALYEEDNRTIKELAVRSQLACSTLTGLLARMETAGLIDRKRDCQDGRLVRVRLTSLGRKLETKCRDMARQVSSLAERGVGPRNVTKAKVLLQGMTAAFRAEEHRLAASQAPQRGDRKN